MKKHIDHDEYIDAPMIYGQHAPYWSSLSFFDKLCTIRRVGLFSFLREVLGYGDAERIRTRLEISQAALMQECETLRARIKELGGDSEQAKTVEQKTTQDSGQSSKSEYTGINPKILMPPQADEIMAAFNRNCPERAKPWFFNPYEKPGSGDIVLSHNFGFYPFAELIVPRGKLRLRKQDGYVANLAQCMDFAALPSRYARHLVPPCFHPHRMRVLFVTRHKFDLYLDEPRSAQDLVLEIRTHYERDATVSDEGHLDTYDAAIKSWKEQYHGIVYGTRHETLFDLVVSVEDLFNDGENNFSREQTERIRKRCYAEYLDIYFGDRYDD